MASACIHEQDLGRYRTKNGTRKMIQYNNGEQCIGPVYTLCWKSFKSLSNLVSKKLF